MARKQLPPKFISVIYSVFGMVALILFYFGIIYGIRFTSAMEGAWAFAFIVALVQEFFIHQLVVAAVRASAVVLLQPLRSDKNEEQDNGQIPQSHQSSKNHKAITNLRNMERIRKLQPLATSKQQTDKNDM